MPSDWLELNRRNWEARVPIHLRSEFYDIDAFKSGKSTLRPEEIADLAPVTGKSLLHLQCHFGLDTLSWAREGAQVTGLDFSPAAIDAANALKDELGINAEFVTANVYDASGVLDAHFDIVYTGLGALCWLPDINLWAQMVAALMKPGGQFYMLEFHPIEWVFGNDLTIEYPYFSPKDGERLVDEETYTGKSEKLSQPETRQWNHNIGEVVTALVKAGLAINEVAEYDECVLQRWPFMEKKGSGRYRFPEGMPNLPLLYKIRASK